MGNRKYEFTGETRLFLGKTLRQIKALISFGSVSSGDLGGWIEKEENLSQDGDAWVYGNARVSGNASVYGNASVSGDASVSGNARVYGDARVSGDADFMLISKIGSRNDTITFMKNKELKIIVAVGCFIGTIDEFENKVKETHGDNKHAQAYFLAIQLAKLRINLEEKGEQKQ